MSSTEAASLLRVRHGHDHARVTFVELFFDLVFVFAVTQLSHGLAAHLTLLGAVQTGLLMLAVWWVWIFTSWATNWLDPDRLAVRLLLFALMLAGLVLSIAIPHAFDSTALAFALAYVAMQVGRNLFMLRALAGRHQAHSSFQRITLWFGLSALFWIGGALVEGEARLGLWGIAIALEFVSPSLGFWVPGMGRAATTDWASIEGGHLAERCGLFIIIALGESILVTGATFGDQPMNAGRIAAFLVAFLGSVAMWWIYFNIGAERGSGHITASDDPGRLARSAYTYIHLALVAGIIVGAVGDEMVPAHPEAAVDGAMAAILLGGPALYLAGNILFKRAVTGRTPLSHLVGLALLAAALPLAPVLPALPFAAAATLALLVTAVWETMSLREPAATA